MTLVNLRRGLGLGLLVAAAVALGLAGSGFAQDIDIGMDSCMGPSACDGATGREDCGRLSTERVGTLSHARARTTIEAEARS